MRYVGMDRHFIAGQVVVDEEPAPLVDRELLHQCGSRAHGHRSDHLAARRHRIQDSAGGTHREHATDPNLAGEAINGSLDEVSAEGRLLVALVEASPFHLVLGDEFAFADGLGKLGRTVAA